MLVLPSALPEPCCVFCWHALLWKNLHGLLLVLHLYDFLETQYKCRYLYTMSTHPYEHTHTHPTLMSTSERLSQFNLEIHEVGHQERLAVNGDVVSH
jgi:hypothetical protein